MLLVLPRGLNSNRMMQFFEILQGMGKLLKYPEAKNGRYFQWEPFAGAT